MITKKDVHKNLALLDELFNNSKSQKKAIFYSKLAVIELCGWIEAAMDDIILEYTGKKITDPNDIKTINGKVKRNSNLGYSNLRDLTVLLIGLKRVKIIESKLDLTGDFPVLVSTLDNLRTARNKFAHTHIHGTIPSITSPFSVLTSFNTVFRILKLYQIQLNKH